MQGAFAHFALGLLIGVPLSVRFEATAVMAIRDVERRGWIAGPSAAAGAVIADLVLFSILAAIVVPEPTALLESRWPGLALGLAAAATLVFLGFRLMDDRRSGALGRERGEVLLRAYHENPLLDRLIGALLSPPRQLFWWTAGIWLVAGAARSGDLAVPALALGFVVAGLAWPTFVSVRLSDRLRESALSDRQYRVVASLGGLAVASVGLWIAATTLAASGAREPLERMAAELFG